MKYWESLPGVGSGSSPKEWRRPLLSCPSSPAPLSPSSSPQQVPGVADDDGMTMCSRSILLTLFLLFLLWLYWAHG